MSSSGMSNHGLPLIIDEAAEQAHGGLRDTISLVEGRIRQSTNVALDTGVTRKTFGRRESVLKHLLLDKSPRRYASRALRFHIPGLTCVQRTEHRLTECSMLRAINPNPAGPPRTHLARLITFNRHH
jgi:hypothetical protein